MDCKETRYAIREVSELTGVKPVTLRAWQRRYNLIQPKRSDKGHRLYSEHDINTIRQIQSWLLKGVAIGKVSQLLQANELIDAELPLETAAELQACHQLLDALAQLNGVKAANVLATVMKEYPLDIVETQFVLPVIEALEKVKGPLRSLQKGLFNSVMLSKLSSILEAENKAAYKGKCLCVSFEHGGHILAWLWAVSWAEKGYQVTFMEGIDDITGLVDHQGSTNYSSLALFSYRHLSDNQRKALTALKTQFSEAIYFSEVLATLVKQED
ncbi:MerR family transcriptional regulator [Vibrio sp.]|uniref:MerR family transcriptional regulator n=1 Tax=Vibrio sp. TaxID=678 RepID=UPI003D12127D